MRRLNSHRSSFLSAAVTITMLAGVANLGWSAVSDQFLTTWLQRRTSNLERHFSSRPFDQIGWAGDLAAARKLAREHQRPLMVFTHDGRINVGRC